MLKYIILCLAKALNETADIKNIPNAATTRSFKHSACVCVRLFFRNLYEDTTRAMKTYSGILQDQVYHIFYPQQ